jgi:hypothetical protein
MEHLEQVLYWQSLIKATSWSTFIARLGASDESVASKLTDRLQSMCSILPYDFARRALRMLKRTRWKIEANLAAQDGWIGHLYAIILIT